MGIPGWVLPVGTALYRNRRLIGQAAKAAYGVTKGSQRVVGVTGLPGVGKSTLIEYLTGDAFERGWIPPQPSTQRETHQIRLDTQRGPKRLSLTVVPGTQSPERSQTLQTLFNREDRLDGLIHVVSFGYSQPADPAERDAFLRGGFNTIDRLRKEMLHREAQEIADLAALIRHVHQAKERTTPSKPRWLALAVTKVDLFADRLEEAQGHYDPDKNGTVGRLLANLQADLGRMHFTVSAVPVCASLQPFVWNNSSVPSEMKSDGRDQMLGGLVEMLENPPGGVPSK